jgi:hypothetical protein
MREEYPVGDPTVEWRWGIGTPVTAWGKRIEAGAPKRATS